MNRITHLLHHSYGVRSPGASLAGVLGASLVALAGCDEGALDGPNLGADVQESDAGEPDGMTPAPVREPMFAVHLRGDMAAGVALLDQHGEVLNPAFIHSGSLPSGLSQLLGDIALPTQPDAEGTLAIVARPPQNSVIRLDLSGDGEIQQFSTQLPSEGAAFDSNPHDYLYVDEHSAWVTRFQPNLDPNADELNRGDDLLEVDPSDGRLLGRVALDALQVEVDYERVDETGTRTLRETAYARPSSLVRTGNHVLVGVDRLTLDFGGHAPGAVAVLDLASRSVTSVELPGMANCGQLTPVVGRTDAAIASCRGVPWGSAANAGLALISVNDEGSVTLEQTFRPGAGPRAVFGVISLGGTEVVVNESGWVTGEEDHLFRLDLSDGQLEHFHDMSGSGHAGFSGAFLPETDLLLIGDRNREDTGVFRFRVGEQVELLSKVAFPSALPVDGVRSLARP